MDTETKEQEEITVRTLYRYMKTIPQILTVQDVDSYNPVGAAYRTMETIARNSNLEEVGGKFDFIEEKERRDFKRVLVAFEKVPYSKDIPIKRDDV